MHVGVDLLVLRLPLDGHDCDAFGEPDVVQLAYRELEGILVPPDSSQEQASLLVQVVIGQQLKYLVRNVEVALFKECHHGLLEHLDRFARFYSFEVQLGRLRVAEPLQLLLGVLHVEAT